MKNKIYKIALVLSAFVFAIACENTDDLTGDSVVSPSNPALSVSLDFGPTESLIETEADYGFTVSLSQPQVVAVEVYLELLPNSTASEGSDLSFPHHIRIPAGSTSVSDVITIHGDDLAEDTETAVIRIGTGKEANVSATNSQVVSFNIMNYTEGDIAIDMTWTSPQDFTDNFGNAIDDEEIGDLILYVSDANIPTSINYLTVDNAFGFESFVFEEAYPDGEYYLVAGFYSAGDFGGNDAALDISLTFNQPGVINNRVVTVPNALNTAFASCQTSVIAKLTKSGTNYTIESVGLANSVGVPASDMYVGDYSMTVSGTNAFGVPSFDDQTVTLVANGNSRTIEDLSYLPAFGGFAIDFTFEFVDACGLTTVPEYDTGVGCVAGAEAMFLGPSGSDASYSVDDDMTLIVNFQDASNAGNSCDAPASEIVLTFTKL
ncbi:hypothetical protein [Algibacter luteus]|uniref:Calx-beta domain-containing protein n=1 Tax=Algibacter luteus TaxID=1178825 RepID=A0A1M6AFN9_9FLAO|nr:hypothetical protein [Algibacter luteus]SHI35232.1 hypothetical protein SAMN05216261_0398 [Algibacter luteus]